MTFPQTAAEFMAAFPPSPHCDLCGDTCTPDDWADAAGLFICPECLEAALDARTMEQLA
jgi:hypothetical protein